MGIILGDFNICDPEEGRFNVWNQTFTDGDPRKTAMFHSFFPHVLEVAQPDYYSHRNQFERFRWFLELISRFEFDFRRRGNIF